MSKHFRATYLPYSETGFFTKIVTDYISGDESLKGFYSQPPGIDGIKASILLRKNFKTDRVLLVRELKGQYENVSQSERVSHNMELLLQENTFTICTAHQPNIFTGHLYFIYKILQTIKLAEELKQELPENNFVPVFFMGSEDADLAELNHLVIDGKKYKWETNQKGAVGRMRVDDNLVKLIDAISGRISVEEYGPEIIRTLKECFQKNTTIERATFLLVHELFKSYGLVVLLPDNAAFKKAMLPIFEDDLFNNQPSDIVSDTSEKLSEKYKVQAHPREINLFYLKGDIRNRIVPVKENFVVHDTNIVFTKAALKEELHEHTGNFSPNVILRGLFQEIILPNIAFIGGGGELAYWLELKDLFDHYGVPYPILVLRNSFLLIGNKYSNLIEQLNILPRNLFTGEEQILKEIVERSTGNHLQLDSEMAELRNTYNKIKDAVTRIDTTLVDHTEALEAKALKALSALEKKMLRAEKRKFTDTKNQLDKVFSALFTGGDLQERTENFMLFYAKWGSAFFEILYEKSLALEQEFCIIEEAS